MKNPIKAPSLFGGIICLLTVMFLSVSVYARTGKVDLTDKIKTVPPRSTLFDKDIQPLKLEQCAQCHIGVFNLLKTEGRRHQKECTFCHEVYHTFASGKVEYKDAIPKCTACHGLPHGENPLVTNCQGCHSNAHSPLHLPNITSDMCVNCHANPPKQLQDFPSKHTDLACTDCHTSHGYIPNCIDCHSEVGGEPFHVDGKQTNKLCLSCHTNPHTPLEIKYTEDTPKELCGNCHVNPSHARVYATLKKANSAHFTDNTCAGCHDEHGKIPSCSKCHDDEGHRAGLKTEDCLRCHRDPHDPMNITFLPTEPKKICGGCHTEVYKDLMNSKTRHTNQTCAFCHPKHGQIPTCQKCHGVPHGAAMLKQFDGKCGACHDIAHKVTGKVKVGGKVDLTPAGQKGVLTAFKKAAQ